MALDHIRVHRWAKWAWIVLGIPVSFVLRESLVWIVTLSVYAIIVGHWSSEEAAEAKAAADDSRDG